MNRRKFIKSLGILGTVPMFSASAFSEVKELDLTLDLICTIMNDIEHQIQTEVFGIVYGYFNDSVTQKSVVNYLNDYVDSNYINFANNINFICDDRNNTPSIVDENKFVIECSIMHSNGSVVKKRFTLNLCNDIIWFAPAGVNRGFECGMTVVGYDEKLF